MKILGFLVCWKELVCEKCMENRFNLSLNVF